MPLTLQNETSFEAKIDFLLEAGHKLLRVESRERCLVDVLLVDDETIQEMNLEYRGRDSPTDVLSFAQSEVIEGEEPPLRNAEYPEHLGDVVISVETAARQAFTHAVTLEQELALLTVHGILHLLGYEDETFEGTAEMRQCEKAILDFSYPLQAFPE